MKTCKHCNINVGGEQQHCPFCQSPLVGDASESLWPTAYKLKTASLLWKIFLFIAVSICVAAVFCDYGFMTVEHRHFSHMVVFLAAITVYGTWLYIKSHRSVPRMIFRGTVLVSLILAHFGWYLDLLFKVLDYAIPGIFIAALIANFVFCFIDAGFTEDSFLCIILNILACFVPGIIVKITGRAIPFMWKLTLLLSIISLMGIIIFKGRTLSIELKKRLNI